MPAGLGTTLEAFRKLAPVPLLALGLASAALLFTSDSVAGTLGILEFRNSYRGWIGAVFLVTWSYLAAHLVWWLRRKLIEHLEHRRRRRVRESFLKKLTPEERGYLVPYVLDKVNTQNFPMEDGIIGGLSGKEIVYRSSNVIDPVRGAPWNIQPWALEVLSLHPELLNRRARFCAMC